MVSGFGPSSLSPALNRSSEWFPVANRIMNPAYHLVSVCVVLADFLGLARPGVLAEMRLCLNLGCSFAFLPGDLTRLRESPWLCETSVLQEYAIEILSNSGLLKILCLGMAYLHVKFLRNEGFSHLESIWGQGIPTFAEYSMHSAFHAESIFNTGRKMKKKTKHTILGFSLLLGKVTNYHGCCLCQPLYAILNFHRLPFSPMLFP